MLEQVFCLVNVQIGTAHTVHGRSVAFKKGGQIFGGVIEQSPPPAAKLGSAVDCSPQKLNSFAYKYATVNIPPVIVFVVMVILWNGQTIIFSSCGFFLLSFFSSPNLSGRTLDVYHMLRHMLGP